MKQKAIEILAGVVCVVLLALFVRFFIDRTLDEIDQDARNVKAYQEAVERGEFLIFGN